MNRPRSIGFVQVKDFRWLVSIGAAILASLAVHWGVLLVAVVWSLGFYVYLFFERRFSPDDRRPVWKMYLSRSVVAYVFVVLSMFLFFIPPVPQLADWATQAFGLRFEPTWTDLPLMIVFLLLPLFAVVGSNNPRSHWGMTTVCAVTAAGYMKFLEGYGIDGGLALGSAMAIGFVSLMVWHFHAGLLANALIFEGIWRRLVAIENPRADNESEFFGKLVSALEDAGLSHQKSLILFVPTRRRWRWYNPQSLSLEWLEPTEALENVLMNPEVPVGRDESTAQAAGAENLAQVRHPRGDGRRSLAYPARTRCGWELCPPARRGRDNRPARADQVCPRAVVLVAC